MRASTFVVSLASAIFLGTLALVVSLQGQATQFAGVDVPSMVMSDSTRLVIGVGAAVLAVLALGLAVVAVLPRRGARMLALQTSDGGSITLPARDVARRIAEDVRSLAAVEQASAGVHMEKDGVAVDLALVLQPEAELPATVDAVTSRVTDALSRRYGASLSGKPRIRVRYAEGPGDHAQPAGAAATG